MASERAGEGPLTRDEIEAFAADWYRKLDEHVPAADIVPLVLDQGLEFVVPEATLRSRNEFGQWLVGGGGHPGVYNLFFDEVHTLSRVEVQPGGTACGSRWSSTGRPGAGTRPLRAAGGSASMRSRHGKWSDRRRRERR